MATKQYVFALSPGSYTMAWALLASGEAQWARRKHPPRVRAGFNRNTGAIVEAGTGLSGLSVFLWCLADG